MQAPSYKSHTVKYINSKYSVEREILFCSSITEFQICSSHLSFCPHRVFVTVSCMRIFYWQNELCWRESVCFVSLWKLSALCLCLLIRLFSVGSLSPAFVIPPSLPLSRNKWGIKTESSGTEDRDGREARRWQQLTGNRRMDFFCLQDLKSTRLEHSSSAFCYVPVPVGCNVK